VGASADVKAPPATLAVNKWIIGEVVETLTKLDAAFADLRYDAMADAIYHFAWGTFCDWYIELVKGAFDDETRAVAGWVFDQILVMLHPFMPFITEELWDKMGARDGHLLIHARWPEPEAVVDAGASEEIRWVVGLIDAIRSTRTETSVPPGAQISLMLQQEDRSVFARLEDATQMLVRVARTRPSGWGTAPGPVFVYDGISYLLPLVGIIDLDAERARLTKSAEAAEKEAASLAGRLNNPAFVEKAKPEAVEKARADHADKSAEAERLRAALSRLG
jgi:valyl-tRNA synthetase